MSLNEFHPKSPDPALTNEGDSGAAKFGHLNILVAAINKLTPLIGTDTPVGSIVPTMIGQLYIDTLSTSVYISVGKENDSQWVLLYGAA